MSRGGIQSFRTERLSQVLAARRLSQSQLAALIGVSPASISKWRSGAQAPEIEALTRLANAVNVPPEWFTRDPSPKVSEPMFRSNASAHASARAMLEARIEWAQDVAIALSEFVEYPPLNSPTLSFKDPEEITNADIESAANQCRDAWKLGRSPVQDLAMAVEGAGVILIREETGVPQIEGLSAWSEALERPLVLLSADKDNGYRSRFDLAHELGHLVLHRHTARPSERNRHKLLEQQAHRFAGAFLLPAETFAGEIRTPVTLDDLLLQKLRWGVSASAMIMRLRTLDILSDDGAQHLFKRRSARWGARSEPGDGDRPPERPRLLRRAIDLLVDEGVMPLASIPRHIGLATRDVEMLAALPEGYFSGEKPEVVDIARIRNASQDTNRSNFGESTGGGSVVPFSSKTAK